jgi:hypothetical protein
MSTGLAPSRRARGIGHHARALVALTALVVAATVVALLVAHTSGTAPAIGSGVPATQARPLAPFTGVDLAGANNVVVRVGSPQAVTVHADSNLLDRVTTEVRSGSLVIGNTPGSFSAQTPMFVTVSVPALGAVTLHGFGNISVTGIDGRELTVRLPGSGTIDAAGTTARLDVAIGGAGTARLGRLIARDAKASLPGSGTIMLRATHSLDARISGSGTIVYTGNPAQVTKSASGNGTITGG